MATRIQVRRGSTSDWNTPDPILNEGEIGYNTTLGQIKVGDGETVWSELDYLVSAGSLDTSLGSYIPDTEKSAVSGVAELDASKNILAPAGIIFEGTANDFETTLAVTDPTGDRTITHPNVTGTVITSGNLTEAFPSQSGNSGKYLSTNGSGSLSWETVSGYLAPTLGSTSIGSGATVTTISGLTLSTPTVSGLTISDSSIVIEGATANDFETTITFTDPTEDRTITFPNATGTVALAGNVAALSGATFTGAIEGTSLTLSGDLTVNGTTTNINSTNLVVEDKNIVLGDTTTPTDTTADGGGLTLKGATDHTFNWINATDAWTSSEHMDLASGKSYKINNVAISTALPALTWSDVKNGKSGLTIS